MCPYKSGHSSIVQGACPSVCMLVDLQQRPRRSKKIFDCLESLENMFQKIYKKLPFLQNHLFHHEQCTNIMVDKCVCSHVWSFFSHPVMSHQKKCRLTISPNSVLQPKNVYFERPRQRQKHSLISFWSLANFPPVFVWQCCSGSGWIYYYLKNYLCYMITQLVIKMI